jgi:superfamily I DNA and/or RNA helicase
MLVHKQHTSGSSISRLAAAALQVVVVEEAGAVLEAHLLACLTQHSEHLLLIGDHEQLRPKVELWEMQAASGRGFDLDVSLFERLVTRTGLSKQVGCLVLVRAWRYLETPRAS